MSEDQACEVPLVEQLRSVPEDYRTVRAIQWAADGMEIGHQFIPVGFMMHRAAAEIERLRAAAPEEQRWMYAGRAENLPDGPPVDPGTKLYAFDARGTWTYNLPPLPQNGST